MRIKLPGSVARLSPHRRGIAALAATAFIIAVSLCGVLSCSHEAPLDTIGEPRIAFEKEFINLGKAVPGQEVYAEFRYRNEGDADLVISEVTTEALTEGC